MYSNYGTILVALNFIIMASCLYFCIPCTTPVFAVCVTVLHLCLQFVFEYYTCVCDDSGRRWSLIGRVRGDELLCPDHKFLQDGYKKSGILT